VPPVRRLAPLLPARRAAVRRLAPLLSARRAAVRRLAPLLSARRAAVRRLAPLLSARRAAVRRLVPLSLALLAGAAALAASGAAQEPAPPPPPAPPALAIGLAEANPALIAPGRVRPGFRRWRDRTAALRPRYFRLLVDWSNVQPSGRRPPDWRRYRDGCARGRPPCAPHRGLGAVLRAVGRRQRADGGWEVVVSPYFAPRWATAARRGCPSGRRIRIRPYRRFLRSLAALGRREGVPLRLWSPWNEPNHPAFLRPQRTSCARDSRSVAPAAYADLVRAARSELGPDVQLLIGELAGYRHPRRTATGVVEFVRGLPQDVACAGSIFGQHMYVGTGRSRLGGDLRESGQPELLAALQRALDAHGCPVQHRIWITETGAFPRARACERMHAALTTWARDPRVDAAFQYTVREDPVFRTGLVTERFDRTRPAYAAWRAWAASPAAEPADPC
jgi:hypothetical protein